MSRTYAPPPCGHLGVTADNAISAWPAFFGWKCRDCGGPLYLSSSAAYAISQGKNDPYATEPVGFLHDTRSDFYWREDASGVGR